MNLYHKVSAQWLAYLVFFVILAVVPLAVSDMFLLNQLATYGVFGMLALSISLCWGFGGILNLGQGIPFGLGAYGMAMTMQMQSQDASNPMPPFMLNNSLDHLPGLWVPFGSTVVGIILALGRAHLVLRGVRLAHVPRPGLGAVLCDHDAGDAQRMVHVILDMQPYTNGVNGITPPAPLKIGDFAIDPYSSGAYWLVLALLAAATVAAKLMTRSRFGLVVQAIRDDAERVRFLGYNVAGYETAIYTVSGFFAAVAGCCWVMMAQYVSPAQFDITFSLSMVIWAGIGGRLSLMGSRSSARS